MTGYVVRRLIRAVPTLLGATLLGFALIHLAPGDPIQFYAAQTSGMSAEDVERLRHLYGLDQPLVVQYLNWLAQLAQLDFGVSFSSHQPVLDSIAERVPATLTLTGSALVMGTCLGVAVGVLAGLKRGSLFDRGPLRRVGRRPGHLAEQHRPLRSRAVPGAHHRRPDELDGRRAPGARPGAAGPRV
jgi:ABC-type dipeptide/oligopeptide/nickel transport system permease component